MAKPVREATTSVWMETAEVPRHQIPGEGRAGGRLRDRRRHRRTDHGLPARPRGQERRRPGRRAHRRRPDPAHHGPPVQRHRRPLHRGREDPRRGGQPPGRREPHRGHRPDRGHRRTKRGSTATSARVDGYLFLAPGQSADLLEEEREAAHRAGLKDVDFVPRAPLPRSIRAAASASRARASSTRSSTSPGWRRPSGSKAGRSTPILMPRGSTAGEGRDQGRARWSPPAPSWWPPTRPSTTSWPSTPSRRPISPTPSAPASRRARSTRALYWDTLDAYHYIRVQPMERAATC